jgi:uncharacterized protein YdhG (YjbR/CyaY superfamily)
MRKGMSDPRTVDEYLARVPEPARGTLVKVRAAIRAVAPMGATESISYGIPMFKHEGMLIGFAAFAKHCSLFPGAEPIAELQSELMAFSTAKGTIRFAVDKPPSRALIKKLIQIRLRRNAEKKEARKRKS